VGDRQKKQMLVWRPLNINVYTKTKSYYFIYSVAEQIEECHRLSIDIKKIISNILKQFPKNCSRLMFTDICPIHITNRRYAISVLVEILG